MEYNDIEIKNLFYTDTEECYECEINHKKYGWIPFTIYKNDPEELGQFLYNNVISGVYGTPQTPIIEIPDEKNV